MTSTSPAQSYLLSSGHGLRPPSNRLTGVPALAIVEKALGSEHPSVAASLANYAALLRKTGRSDEAAKMEARAKAIRAQVR